MLVSDSELACGALRNPGRRGSQQMLSTGSPLGILERAGTWQPT